MRRTIATHPVHGVGILQRYSRDGLQAFIWWQGLKLICEGGDPDAHECGWYDLTELEIHRP